MAISLCQPYNVLDFEDAILAGRAKAGLATPQTYDAIAYAALRIAAAVMRPGAIEKALGEHLDYPPHEAGVIDGAHLIRKALTDG